MAEAIPAPSSQVGHVGQVAVQIVRTTQPWTLDADAFLVPIDAAGSGSLGAAYDAAFPARPISAVDLATVTPDTAYIHPLMSAQGNGSAIAVLVRLGRTPSAGFAGVSMARAPLYWAIVYSLRGAASRQAEGLSVPLRSFGGFPVEEVVSATANALRLVTEDRSALSIQQVLLFDDEPAVVAAARLAWPVATPPEGLASEVPASEVPASEVPASELPPSEVQTAFSEPPAALANGVRLSRTAHEVFAAATATAAEYGGSLTPQLIFYEALARAATSRSRDVAALILNGLVAHFNDTDPRRTVDRLAGLRTVTRPASPSSTEIQEVFSVAGQTVVRVSSGGEIHLRHLLAAVVSDSQAAAAIAGVTGWTPVELRSSLRAAIASTLPREAPQTWDEILLTEPTVTPGKTGDPAAVSPAIAEPDGDPSGAEPAARVGEVDRDRASVLTGGISTDLVDPDRGIPLSQDYLGIKTFVEMLATVIADRDTPLPLSIGLFGEWGSGKSYFMGLLRQQIDDLSKSDSESYLGGIEHIGFNAWHYADTNLWASLGNTIFEKLAGGADANDARRRKLRAELVEKLDRRQDLDQATERAQQETETLRASLQIARTDRASAGRNLLKAMTESPAAKGLLADAWRRLGVADETEKEQLLVSEAQGLRSDGLVLRRATSGLRGVAVAALLIASLALIGVALFTPPSVRHWLGGTGVAGIAAGLGAAAALIARVRSGVHKLGLVVSQTRDRALAEADGQLQASYEELNLAVTREQVLIAQRDEAIARVGEIGRELADLDPGRQWYGFVADRAASSEYRGQLGLVSTIRRDFKRLVALMDDWRKNPGEHGEYDPINRIVLYIDDLDRCSPRQVMDVLQAVHLLLALDLFVVVVGVDPRWLLQSLRQQYRENFSHEHANDEPVGGGEWAAEPLDYLEKIFNIPFVLPRMTTTSFATLIRNISADTQRAADERRERPAAGATATGPGHAATAGAAEAPETTDPGSQEASDAGMTTDLIAAAIPVEAGSPVALARAGVTAPTRRGLTEPELVMLGCLGDVVESPREAKRLLNLYRILRSTRSADSPASDFLERAGGGGEYQAVVVLLGILSAQPELFGDLMAAAPRPGPDGWAGGLRHRDPTTTWSDLAADLIPVAGDDDCRNGLGLLSVDRSREWTLLLSQLDSVSAHILLPDLRPFQAWGPRIARFSFVLSPLAATVS